MEFEPRSARSQDTHKKRRIWPWIVVLIIVAILGFGGYKGYQLYTAHQAATDYTAVNPKSTKKKEIHIPAGATTTDIAQVLAKAGLVRSTTPVLNYLAVHGAENLKAGYFQLSKAMPIKTLIAKIEAGGTSYPLNNTHAVIVREGEMASDIADEVAAKTKFSKQDFLKALNDTTFLTFLNKTYPGFLDSAIASKKTRYKLEGYLYPATYDIMSVKSVKDLIQIMVSTEYDNVQPLLSDIKKADMTTQEVLTLASIVEKEGVDAKNRAIIAGVFLNRLAINMPIQSDITVKYALNSDKVNLTNADVQVNSPYNLYKNSGLGPGPFNSPSLESIEAVLNPKDRDKDYLYFVANLKTGAIVYNHDYAKHQAAASSLESINNQVADEASSKKSSK